jgi:hypothetical protein
MTSSTAGQCYGHNRTYCKRVSIGNPFVNWSPVPSKIDTRALIRNPKALKPSNGECFAGDPVSRANTTAPRIFIRPLSVD